MILREMPVAKPRRAVRVRGLLVLAAAALACTLATSAKAGSIFDFLTGSPVRAYAAPDPRTEYTVRSEPAPASAAAVATSSHSFCVRLCDGRYYPIASSAPNSTPVQMCSAMCPAAKTKVFHGSEIGSATDSSGSNYKRLEQAFAYRKSTVPGCTCNGKDPYGLVSVDVTTDPTLRSGDLVSTGNGLKTIDGRAGTKAASAPAERVSALRD